MQYIYGCVVILVTLCDLDCCSVYAADTYNAVNPYIVIATRSQLIGIASRKNVTVLSSDWMHIGSFDVYHSNDDRIVVFWSDETESKISKMVFNMTDSTAFKSVSSIIESQLESVSSIKIDWLHKHIYWINNKYNMIECSTFDGSYRAAIVTNVHPANGNLVIDPSNRYSFWIDCSNRLLSIKRSHLNGKNQTTVIKLENGCASKSSLTLSVDCDKRILLWTDIPNAVIHSCDYDGMHHQVFVTHFDQLTSVHQPISISFHDDMVYWTEGYKLMSSKIDGKNLEVVYTSSSSILTDVNVVSKIKINSDLHVNPCDNVKFCSHICTPAPEGIVECSCPYGMILLDDLHTCSDVTTLLYVLDEESNNVLTFASDETSKYVKLPFTLPNHSGHKIISSFVDDDDAIYWTTKSLGKLKKTFLVNRTTETILQWDDIQPTSLAIDQLSGNIYVGTKNLQVTTFGHFGSSIAVCSVDGSSFMNLLVSVNEAIFINVDPVNGQMYFFDIYNNVKKLKSAQMDGSKVRILYETSAAITATEYAADRGNFYWIEERIVSEAQSVLMCRTKSGIILEKRLSFSHASSVFSISDYLVIFSKTEGYRSHNVSFLYDDSRLFNKSSLTDINQKKANSCANNKCDNLCLPHSMKEYACPPLSGTSDFISFSRNTFKSSIDGFSITKSGQIATSAFPLGIQTSWVTHSVYSYSTNSIVWVDGISESIQSARRDNKYKLVLKANVKKVGGLAFDWIAGNLYWSHPEESTINVMTLDGKFDRILMYGLHNPSSLALDPLLGYLFWVERKNDSTYSVLRSTLSGKHPVTLINNLESVTSITVDPYTSKVYWCSSESHVLGKLEANGSKQEIIFGSDETFWPTSITFDEKYIYWTDIKYRAGSISRILKASNYLRLVNTKQLQKSDWPYVYEDDVTTLAVNLGNSLSSVHYFKMSNQKGNNPCMENNGGCEKLCLFDGGQSLTCSCSSGLLASDNKSCIPFTKYLVYTHSNKIHSLDLDYPNRPNRPHHPISVTDAENFVQHNPNKIVYDPHLDGLIFTDSLHKSQIYSMTGDSPLKIADVEPGIIHGMFYSVNHRALIWTQVSPSVLKLISYRSETNKWSEPQIIGLLDEDHRPSAVVMDECTSALYFVLEHGDVFSIKRFAMTKKSPLEFYTTVYDISNIRIDAMTIDAVNRMIYWTELDSSHIQNIKIMGYSLRNYRTRVFYAGSKHEPHSLAYYKDHLYWTDWYSDVIQRLNVKTGILTTIKINERKINGLSVVDDSDNIDCAIPLDDILMNGSMLTIDDNSSVNDVTSDKKYQSVSADIAKQVFNDKTILLISLPGILLVVMISILVVIIFFRRRCFFGEKRSRVSYLSSYGHSFSNDLCCSRHSINSASDDLAASSCLYHIEMDCIGRRNEPTSETTDDKRRLLHETY